MALLLVNAKKIIRIMKNVLMVLLISAGVGFSAQAQSKFSFGPTVGLGYTTVSNLTNTKFKLGADAGFSLVYSAVEHFGVGMDVKYSVEGAKWTPTDNEWTLNYIRIPLKAIYFFGKYGSNLRPKIYAGPSFGILTSSKINNVDVKSQTTSFDVALLGGAGLNYRLVKNTWLNTDISYANGLTKLTNSTPPNGDNKNRSLKLNIGINFGL